MYTGGGAFGVAWIFREGFKGGVAGRELLVVFGRRGRCQCSWARDLGLDREFMLT